MLESFSARHAAEKELGDVDVAPIRCFAAVGSQLTLITAGLVRIEISEEL